MFVPSTRSILTGFLVFSLSAASMFLSSGCDKQKEGRFWTRPAEASKYPPGFSHRYELCGGMLNKQMLEIDKTEKEVRFWSDFLATRPPSSMGISAKGCEPVTVGVPGSFVVIPRVSAPTTSAPLNASP